MKKIAVMVLGGLDKDRLIPIDDYLNGNDKIKELTGLEEISAYNILRLGMKNLEVINTPSSYTIQINEDARIGRIHIRSLCELINYGNLEVEGYPIITETMQKIADNIQDYVRLYRREKVRYEHITV